MAEISAVIGAAGVVLLLASPRRTGILAGLVLTALAVAGLSTTGSSVGAGTVLVGVAGLAGAAALAVLFVRQPAWVTPAVLVAAPFRLPLDFGSEHTFFVGVARGGLTGRLLPLYAVVTAGALALAWRLVRGEQVQALTREIAWPAAAFSAFAALSLLWTQAPFAGRDLVQYFVLPFAVLVCVVGHAPFPAWMPRVLAVIGVSLASLFALVGIVQHVTETNVFYTPAVAVGNEYSDFFRVTSFFRDPSIYGRHVVLGIALVVVAVYHRRLGAGVSAALAALLFAGLFFSYSQSSLVALFIAVLFVVLVSADRPTRLVAIGLTLVVVFGGAAFVAERVAASSAQKVTSDRSRRIELSARVYAEHPVAGVGIGAQTRASQELSTAGGPPSLYVSHSTPLTIAAELGSIGLALFAALLAGATLALLRVVRIDRAFGIGLSAALVVLLTHSLFYAGFLEDPLTSFVLGTAASFLGARTSS